MSGQIRVLAVPHDTPSWNYIEFTKIEPREEAAFSPSAKPVEPEKPVEKRVDPAHIAQAETMKAAAQTGSPFCEQ
jgi:hypothetical protein